MTTQQPHNVVPLLDMASSKVLESRYDLESSKKELLDVVLKIGDAVGSEGKIDSKKPVSGQDNERRERSSNETSKACSICFEDHDNEDSKLVPLEGCSHVFCSSCLRQYVSLRVESRKVNCMPCPMKPVNGCKVEILDEIVREIAGDEILLKMKRFQEENTIERNPFTRWCVNPNCLRAFVLDEKMKESLSNKQTNQKNCERGVCPFCSTELCVHCRRPYHSRSSNKGGCPSLSSSSSSPFCLWRDKRHDRTEDMSAIAEWRAEAKRNGRQLRTCPSCRRTTELVAGCKNMTCICGHRYCWICLAPYPCPNACGQREEAVALPMSREEHKITATQNRILYLKRMGCCMLCVVFAPVWLFISMAVCCTGQVNDRNPESCESYWLCPITSLFLIPTLLAVAMLIACIFAPLGVGYLIYVGIMVVGCVDSGISFPLYSIHYPTAAGLAGTQDGELRLMDDSLEIFSKYEGPLPTWAVMIGKFGIAALWYMISSPVTLSISLGLLPLSPLMLLPITICPQLKTNRIIKILWTLSIIIVTVILGVILKFEADLGARTSLIVCSLFAAVGAFVAIATPTSDWSFLAPFWTGTLAPIAWILGIPNPVNPGLNPFTGPVPFPGPYLVVFQGWNGHITL
mmetsp:Transcript_27215/g.45750  ORF Transcript_27215/g.45750 Transcript_27215/m.45750 type:complete len:630 (+) Transcript_27215:911-2800(+)